MRPKPYVQPLIVELEVKKAVEAVSLALINSITSGVKFVFGNTDDIIKLIQFNKGAVPQRGNYPLIAMFGNPDDVIVKVGGGYTVVTIKVIDIAMVTNSMSLPEKRINETFIPTLYPIYTEFLNQLGKLSVGTGSKIPHTYKKIYGTPTNFTDYLDILEINNMVLTFSTDKC